MLLEKNAYYLHKCNKWGTSWVEAAEIYWKNRNKIRMLPNTVMLLLLWHGSAPVNRTNSQKNYVCAVQTWNPDSHCSWCPHKRVTVSDAFENLLSCLTTARTIKQDNAGYVVHYLKTFMCHRGTHTHAQLELQTRKLHLMVTCWTKLNCV